MSDIRDEVDAIIDDRPETHRVFTEILQIDTEHSVWTFEDIEADTGLFGELVSRGIVEKQDDGYSLADPTAVDAALAHRDDLNYAENTELATDGSRSDVSETVSDDDHSRRQLTDQIDMSVDRVMETISNSRDRILSVVGVLALVVAFRLVAVRSVFQEGYVLLLGNDPYFYRYWVFDFVTANRSPLTVANGIEQGEPLLVATLQIVTALFGGGPAAAEQVLAWYPVAAAVVCGVSVYLIGTRLSDDRRVGLASTAILATLPVHAYRTSIGFADHHAFDVAILAIVFVTVAAYERTSPTSISQLLELTPWIILAGVGIGAHTLAWNAGALLLTPLGVYGVIRALASVRHDVSVLYRLTPLTASMAIGGGIGVLGHEALGWQSTTMIIPPTLLAIALFTLAIVAEGCRRVGLDYRITAIGVVLSGAAVLLGSIELIPRFGDEFRSQTDRLISGPGTENIFEAQSLFSADFGFILAPVIFFGLAIFVSIIVFVWASWTGWTRDRGDLLLICAYGGTLFILSLLQVRFAGHLALPVAILTGISFVWLVAKVTDISPPTVRPVGVGTQSTSEQRVAWRRHTTSTDTDTNAGTTDSSTRERSSGSGDGTSRRQMFTAVIVLFLLVGGLGAVMTPVRTATLTFGDDTASAIDEMDAFATAENRSWPETYVLSRWGDNRAYNSHLNGNSQSYGYARSNYLDFLRSDESEEWYQQIQGRVGFIIISEIPEFSELDSETMYARLHDRQGLGTHYQLLYAGDEKKAYAVVPGTMVNGTVNETKTSVTVSGRMDVGSRTMITQREIPTEDGSYTIRIATPGTYTIGNRTVEVTQEDVVAG